MVVVVVVVSRFNMQDVGLTHEDALGVVQNAAKVAFVSNEGERQKLRDALRPDEPDDEDGGDPHKKDGQGNANTWADMIGFGAILSLMD